MADPRYYQGALTGNLITISIAGKKVGLIQSMQVQEDFGIQPVSGIGQFTPVEHVPSASRVNISCEAIYFKLGQTRAALQAGTNTETTPFTGAGMPDRLKRYTDNLESMGLIPKSAEDALKGAVFTISVFSIGDGQEVRRYIDCTYGGGSISFQKHQIVMQNASFMAIDYSTYLGILERSGQG